MLTGITFTYLNDDNIGTPRVGTNASQGVVWRGNYTPFGPAISTSGTATINLRMPGQYYDAETGLWHNGRRDYSTTLGRYIESDPIGLAGGIGTYSYAENNPIAKADPKGEDDDSYDGTPQQTPIPGSPIQLCAANDNIPGGMTVTCMQGYQWCKALGGSFTSCGSLFARCNQGIPIIWGPGISR